MTEQEKQTIKSEILEELMSQMTNVADLAIEDYSGDNNYSLPYINSSGAMVRARMATFIENAAKNVTAAQVIEAGGIRVGTCSTDATTSAKVVSISNFLLLKHGTIAVIFTKAIDVADATLNVSSTGAKAIHMNGNALQPGVVKAGMTLMLQYDGSYWNVISMMGLEQPASSSAQFVDMGLPSGVKWAKANIDVTTESGFQEVDGQVSPYKYECSFCSWGNTDMHNPVGTSFSGSYNWGGVNEADPWYDGQPYGSTPGAKLTASMAPSQDAARANLGAPWRMPTTEEFAELFANIIYIDADGTEVDTTKTNKIVTVNGIVGLYLKSKINGNTIFFACSGRGDGTSWVARGSNGGYWSASFHSARYARNLIFYSGGVNPQYNDTRYYGFAVRPVQ